MITLENIQESEAKVAQLQNALDSVQTGLERAESVAVAAQAAKRRSRLMLPLVVVAVLAIVIVIVRGRRRSDDPPTGDTADQ